MEALFEESELSTLWTIVTFIGGRSGRTMKKQNLRANVDESANVRLHQKRIAI